jgi:hypothetical protein
MVDEQGESSLLQDEATRQQPMKLDSSAPPLDEDSELWLQRDY